MTTPYTYTQLKADEIRILQLQPKLDEDILQCNLENISLKDKNNSFIALSWTWGEDPKPEEYKNISLNGKQFSIRPNLYGALSALRRDDKIVYLWIDFICINQEDNKEKGSQIPLMADIYKTASEVYVWLGGSANNSDYVMETFRNNKEQDYRSEQFILGLLDILLRPWWTRTWIVQEYVLNKTSPKVFCGHGTGISAELLLDIWRRFSLSKEASPEATLGLFQRRTDIQKLSSRYWLYSLRDSCHHPNKMYLKQNLRNALSWLKSFKAIKPQDKIYRALGLLEPELREQFVGRFGVHTDRLTADVYRDATIYLLENEKSSTIFYDFPVRRQGHPAWPSWVPDFNLDKISHTLSPIRLGDVTSDHLDISRKDVKISQDGLQLSTQGLILDRVNELIVVEDRPFMTTDDNKVFGNIFKILRLLHQIETLAARLHPYKECEVPPEPLWKTLIAGCYGSIKDDDLKDEPGCQTRFEEWMAIPLDAFQNHIMTIMRKMAEKPHIVHKIGHTLSPGRCFFSGEQGSYGISEAGTQNGDVVALLFPEHFIPFILREAGDHFEMVGAAYIPEPFKQTVIKDFKRNDHHLQDIVII